MTLAIILWLKPFKINKPKQFFKLLQKLSKEKTLLMIVYCDKGVEFDNNLFDNKALGFVYNLQLTNEKRSMPKEQYKQYVEVLNNSTLVNQMPIGTNMFKP